MLGDQPAGLGSREEVVDACIQMVPLGRLADAEEIANAAEFLASDQSSSVTGADIAVDDGISQV